MAFLPPQLRALSERGYAQNTAEARLDQILRTSIDDAIAEQFEGVEFILSPIVAVEPFENATDGWTVGPSGINGETVDPLIRRSPCRRVSPIAASRSAYRSPVGDSPMSRCSPPPPRSSEFVPGETATKSLLTWRQQTV
jgi:hypothetical protein